jgi:hypothetical protein
VVYDSDSIAGSRINLPWLTDVLERIDFSVDRLDLSSLRIKHPSRPEHQLTIVLPRFTLLVMSSWAVGSYSEMQILRAINKAHETSFVNTYLLSPQRDQLVVVGRMRLTERISAGDLSVFLREHFEEMGAIMTASGLSEFLA